LDLARLGAPQLRGLAGPVELLDDGGRIHQAGHRHLPLLRIYGALEDTCSFNTYLSASGHHRFCRGGVK
jgi:hypothetical protein